VRKRIIIGTLAACLFIPAVASADFEQELKAGNYAEQKLQRRYPHYSVYASCDQQGRKFWCSVGGSKGNCLVDGHAWVYKNPWRVRLVGVTRNCF